MCVAVKKNKLNSSAFTLIEILVTICIFAVIVVALGATLTSGIRLWKRANESGYEEVNFLIESEKLNENIRETFALEDIPLLGDKHSLQLPSLEGTMIFKSIYSFSPATKKLSLEKTTYENILADKEEIYLKKDLFEVDALEFSYLVYDLEEEAYLWQEEITEESYIPLAVKIKIERHNREIENIVFIPTNFYD